MADLQSDKFIRENISALEIIREQYRLPTELHRTLTNLLEDWKTVETVSFKVEPKYANSPIKPLLKEPTTRSGQDKTSVRPGNLPISSNHGHTVQPPEDMSIRNRKRTEPLMARSPQLPPRLHQVPPQESSHPVNNRPLPPTPHTADKRAPAANPNTVPSNSDEIKRYLNTEKDTSNRPYYVNALSNPVPHPNNAERKPVANPTEAHGTDWSFQNSENARLPTAVPPIEVIQPFSSDLNPHTHRSGKVEFNIFAGEGNTIIQGNEPIEYHNRLHGPKIDKEVNSRTKKSDTYPRERPQFPTPDENFLYTPGQDDQADKTKIERSNSIDVLGTVELKPQLPPRRKSFEAPPPKHRMHLESKPGDPEYTNWLDTYSHKPRQLGGGATFFDGTDINQAADNDNETEEVDSWRKENEPMMSGDEYLVMMFTPVEEAKPTQYKGEKEDDKLTVFNVRELVSEKTELQTEQQGSKRRRVIIERTFTHEEVGFYDLISNHSIFYFYLTEHNVLIQELISLEQPLGKVLTEKLSTFYNIDFGKSVITLGAKIGLLEVNDKINASLQKVENIFKKFYSKGKERIDPRLSLHQSNITTSHLICISQANSTFDKTNFVTYLQKREMDFMKQFQRLFVPLIQGTVPLRKDEIKDLISYLIVIYRIKDWEMLIPEIYRRDQEMKSDIESSIGLIYKCSPEDIIPQVTKLVRNCKLRESIYFYVKINNKLDKKLNDAVLGVSARNLHLISVARNCEIDLVYKWGIGDLETWKFREREIVMQFTDGTKILLSSPELNEELIHAILKSAIDPKKYLFTN